MVQGTGGESLLGVPHFASSDEAFDTSGVVYHRFMRMRLRDDGTVAAVFLLTNATFLTQWANPLWELTGFRVDAESDRIAYHFKTMIERLPQLERGALAIDENTILDEFDAHLGWASFLPSAWLALVSTALGAASVYSFVPHHSLYQFAAFSAWSLVSWWNRAFSSSSSGDEEAENESDALSLADEFAVVGSGWLLGHVERQWGVFSSSGVARSVARGL